MRKALLAFVFGAMGPCALAQQAAVTPSTPPAAAPSSDMKQVQDRPMSVQGAVAGTGGGERRRVAYAIAPSSAASRVMSA